MVRITKRLPKGYEILGSKDSLQQAKSHAKTLEDMSAFDLKTTVFKSHSKYIIAQQRRGGR